MNLNSILSLIGNAAKDILPAIVPGAGAAIAAAHSIGEAFNAAKAMNGGEAPADAEAAHDALFAKVKAHAESTFGRLEGGG